MFEDRKRSSPQPSRNNAIISNDPEQMGSTDLSRYPLCPVVTSVVVVVPISTSVSVLSGRFERFSDEAVGTC